MLARTPRGASKSMTCVTSLYNPEDRITTAVLDQLEGYLVSAAEHCGVLYTLAYIVHIYEVVLITTCLNTGKRHGVFSHPHIPKGARSLVHTDSGVCIIDTNRVVWHCRAPLL